MVGNEKSGARVRETSAGTHESMGLPVHFRARRGSSRLTAGRRYLVLFEEEKSQCLRRGEGCL